MPSPATPVAETPTTPAGRTRVYVIDKHPVICAGLRRIVSQHDDLVFAGSSPSGAQALAELRRVDVDLVLIGSSDDSQLPVHELCRQLGGPPHGLACLALTSSGEAERVRALLNAGVRGVLLTDSDASHILWALRTIAAGGSYLDPQLSAEVMQALAPAARPELSVLTPIEQQVLEQMAAGCSNQDIAQSLCISLGSAKLHVSHVLSLLGVASRTEAVALAARRGLLPKPHPVHSAP